LYLFLAVAVPDDAIGTVLLESQIPPRFVFVGVDANGGGARLERRQHNTKTREPPGSKVREIRAILGSKLLDL